jgi:RNA polymerase sigma-70 factor (ECF subfamily)
VTTLPELVLPSFAAVAPGEAEVALRARFTRIYHQYAPRIRRFLLDLMRDAPLAADATQETFARAYRQPHAMRDDDSVAPWLFGIARNVSLEMRRARWRAERCATGMQVEAPDKCSVRWCSPEAELLDREALSVVEAALAKLSCDRRAALLLRMDHALSYEDIAGLMGWSLSKVKIEIFRAREVLRATYAEYQGGKR